MKSVDTSGTGRAPFIEFEMGDDNTRITANPPGGSIAITAIANDADLSRVVLTNALTQEVFADIDVRYTPAPNIDATANVCEIAAALYWSMWRMQQVKAAKEVV